MPHSGTHTERAAFALLASEIRHFRLGVAAHEWRRAIGFVKTGASPSRSSCANRRSLLPEASVQFEHEAQRVVNRFEVIVPDPSYELAESLVSYGRCLFNEDLGVVTVDGDRGAEDPRRR